MLVHKQGTYPRFPRKTSSFSYGSNFLPYLACAKCREGPSRPVHRGKKAVLLDDIDGTRQWHRPDAPPVDEGRLQQTEVREEPMESERDGINPAAKPSGTGCVECSALGGWWLHLRRCAECGHIGCCDGSPNQHASKHNAATGHPIITSFEPGERWFYDYRTEEFFTGPKLHAPHSHPLDQPVPGPAGAVPSNWQTLLHE